jgi:P4 family phage/plasmid primase-like protien
MSEKPSQNSGATPAKRIRPGILDVVLLKVAGVTSHPDGTLVIPYFGLDGNPSGFYRIRLAQIRPSGQKYDQPAGSGSHVYLPVQVNELLDHNTGRIIPPGSLMLVEGEFKAIALACEKVPAVGLPGLYACKAIKDENNRTIATEVLDDLLAVIKAKGIRRVYFLGDADTSHNFLFAYEAWKLAGNLQELEVDVFLPRLDVRGPKGIDDVRETFLASGKSFPQFLASLVEDAFKLDSSVKSPQMLALWLLNDQLEGIKRLANAGQLAVLSPRLIKVCARARFCRQRDQVNAEGLLNTVSAILELSRTVVEAKVNNEIENLRQKCQQEMPKKGSPESDGEDASAEESAASGPEPEPARASVKTSIFDDPKAAYGRALGELGEPFIETKHSYNINQPFFARIFAINRIAFYDRASKDYYAYNASTGQFDRLCNEAVIANVKADIFTEAAARKITDVGAKISINLLKSLADLIKSDEEASQTDFFKRPPRALPVIHAANGMFRLEKDGSISRHDFSPEFRSRNLISIAYNPDASAPKFSDQLLSPVLCIGDRDALQRYYGAILIGGNRAQKILMLLGGGGTGKGTIVRLGNLIIGRSNVGQLRVAELKGRFETYRLIGKLLLTVVEATYDCLEQRGAETLKALVGHDPMDAEKKHHADPINYDGIFPIIYVSNENPNVRLYGDESAWSRRLVPLLFPDARPPGSAIIENFEEVLFNEEAEGIFAWMVQGALNHWAELLKGQGFSTTQEQKRRVQEITARSRSILSFVLDGLKASGTSDLTSDELYDGYATFCMDKKWHPFPERKFAELVRPLILEHFGIGQSHDVPRFKTNGKTTCVRGYRGITPNQE